MFSLNKLIFNQSVNNIQISPNISSINNYTYDKVYKTNIKIIKSKKKHQEFIKEFINDIPQNMGHRII